MLIFNELEATKLLIYNHRMHNLYVIFAKFLNRCKQVAGNLVNESGNVPKRGDVPRFSQLCDQFMITGNYAKDTVGLYREG